MSAEDDEEASEATHAWVDLGISYAYCKGNFHSVKARAHKLGIFENECLQIKVRFGSLRREMYRTSRKSLETRLAKLVRHVNRLQSKVDAATVAQLIHKQLL